MPRKRRMAKTRRTVDLPAGVRRYLETGEYRTPDGLDQDAYTLAVGVNRGNYARIGELWDTHGAELLEDWRRERPGTRPFAWWVIAAPEPRRCLAGAEYLYPVHAPGDWKWVWRRGFGIPAMRQVGHFEITFESEASYFARLGLLDGDDRERLDEDDFEPDVIAVDIETYDELVRGRRHG